MKAPIVVVGSLNMDLVVHTPRHPQIGETIIGSGFQTFPGGKGANQAVASARLGGAVRMIGRVGVDAFGDELLANAARDGVDTTWIVRDPGAPTGVALITVNDAGQNTIVVASGANMRLSPEDVSAAEAAFEGAAVLLLQLESPLPAVARAVELAHQHGAWVVLNPAPACPLDAGFLKGVDYLIPNQGELALLCGVEGIQEGAARLLQLGIQHLVVTLGENGVLVVEDSQNALIPAHRVQAVDTTAAGDAFVGAFAVALTEGLDALQAAAWGNAAGAISVTRPGAQPSLPTRAELEDFLARAS
jgi:ribokinase